MGSGFGGGVSGWEGGFFSVLGWVLSYLPSPSHAHPPPVPPTPETAPPLGPGALRVDPPICASPHPASPGGASAGVMPLPFDLP